jgi:hypothetical protein
MIALGVLQDVRDWVVIITGIIWALLYLGIFAVAVVVFTLANKYLNKAHALMAKKVRPMVGSVQDRAEQVRLKTLTLPGQPPIPGAESVVSTLPISTSLRPLLPRLPFLRRKRPWYQRMLPR